MRKLLVVLMVVAFAATAFAADVKLSGGFEVKGVYLENGDALKKSKGNASWWEQDGNVQSVFSFGKGTKLTVRGDFRDGTWGTEDMKAKVNGENENNFTIQRAFIQHVFENGLDLRAGLMATGGWGTEFRNNVEGNYRVRLGIPVANGVLTFQTTKYYESGGFESNTNVEIPTGLAYKDANKDDWDQYGVDYVGKVDAFTYGANLTYTVDGRVNKGHAANDNAVPPVAEVKGNSDSKDTLDLTLLFKGDFGKFAFESEFAYVDVTTDLAGAKNYNLWGAYVNAWGKFGKLTPGLAFMYGSTADSSKTTNEQAGFEFGDDFNTTILVDLTDGFNLSGAGYTTNGDLSGYTAVKAYVDYAHNDALTLGAAFIYASSNWDSGFAKDAKLYEFDAYASYDLTENLNYTVQAGYAQADHMNGKSYNSDPIYLAAHTLSVSF